jgi:TIR domain
MGDAFPRHVFISYAREDATFVERLRNDLEAAGISIWIDTKELIPGTPDWENSIRRAVDASFAVVLVGSPAARDSGFVGAELAIAQDKHVPLIPVWSSGDAWTDCAPLDLARTQYADLRGVAYQTSIHSLAARIKEVIESRRRKHGLISNPNAGQYYAQGSLGLVGVPGYVSVQLDNQRTDQDTTAVFHASAYGSLQALLDDLYMHYLSERFEPVTYGREWVLLEDWVHPEIFKSEYLPHRGINPQRLVLPWQWLRNHPATETASLTPRWGHSPLSDHDIFPQSELTVCGLLENDFAGQVYGIAVNSRALYREILIGDGKQPLSVWRAGFVEVAPVEQINASKYRYLALAVDVWGSFAGRVLCETDQVFDPHYDPYA